MPPSNNSDNNIAPDFLDGRVRDMNEGLTEAIELEIERLRRDGLPIYVSDNGKVVDLQETQSDFH